MLRRLVAAFTAMALPAHAGLFEQSEIDYARSAYSANVRIQLYEDMGVSQDIALTMPDRGPNPLSVWADPASQTISFPVETIMFIDDLGILWTHLDRQGCDLNYIITYLHALLREGRDLPGPLQAFQIDRDAALEDEYVNDVSGKIITSAVYFLLAHETGHLLLGHRVLDAGAHSIAQEIAADEVALSAFREKGILPFGVTFYFLAARWLDPTRENAMSSTHPLSGNRIAKLGEAILADPQAFSHSQPDPEAALDRANSIGADLIRVARRIGDDGVVGVLPTGLALAYPLDKLTEACR